MNLNSPKISVIVCCFMQAEDLNFALKSVLTQSFFSWECIIVDDGSPDHTSQVAQKWVAKDPRFKYIKQKNGGLSSARNSGINLAEGKYVMPLDADDTFPADILEKIYNLFITEQDSDFIFGNYTLFDNKKNEEHVIDCSKISENKKLNIKKLLDNWILLGTSPFKKTIWEKVNGYSLKYSNTVQDLDFWIRAIKAGAKGVYINECIYIWQRSEFGMNATFNRKDYFLLMEEHLSFIKLYRTETENEISLGFYSNYLLKEMCFFNIKHFFSISLKNNLRFFWLIVIFLSKLKNQK